MTDYDTISAGDFGVGLRGIGLNILVTDVARTAAMLRDVFDMRIHQPTRDFAIVTYGAQVFQLHADHTYHSHPLLGLLPETPPRGAGIELRLYDTDPDIACARAEAAGMTVLHPPVDKPPHRLRECCLLDADGYAWMPSRPMT